jgi:hypothetical protein
MRRVKADYLVPASLLVATFAVTAACGSGGDPKKAHGYFKNVSNQVVDEFDITKD